MKPRAVVVAIAVQHPKQLAVRNRMVPIINILCTFCFVYNKYYFNLNLQEF